MQSPTKTVTRIKAALVKKHNLKNPDMLDYIGDSCLEDIQAGLRLLQFNVLQQGHVKYGSTVAMNNIKEVKF